MDFKVSYMDLEKSSVSLIKKLAEESPYEITVQARGSAVTKYLVSSMLKDVKMSTLFLKEKFRSKIETAENPIEDDRIVYVTADIDIEKVFKELYDVGTQPKEQPKKEEPKKEPPKSTSGLFNQVPPKQEVKQEVRPQPTATNPYSQPVQPSYSPPYSGYVPPQSVQPITQSPAISQTTPSMVPKLTEKNSTIKDNDEISNLKIPDKLSEAQVMIIKQREKHDELVSKLNVFEKNYPIIKKNLEDLNNDCSKLRLSNEELQSQVVKLSVDCENKTLELKSLRDDVTTYKSRISSLSSSLNKAEDELSSANVRLYSLKELEAEKTRLEGELTQSINMHEKAIRESQLKDEEINSQKYKVMEIQRDKGVLESSLENLKAEREQLSKTISTLQAQYNEKANLIDNMQLEIRKYQSEIETMTSKFEYLTKSLEDKTASLDDILTRNRLSTQEATEAKQEVNRLNFELNSANARIQKLNEDLELANMKPKMLDVVATEREPVQEQVVIISEMKRISKPLRNITFFTRGDGASIHPYYALLVDNLDDFVFIDLDTDSILDSFVKLTKAGNPNKWLNGKYLDLEIVKSTAKGYNNLIVTTVNSGLNAEDFAKADWGTLLDSIPTDLPVIFNLGSLSNYNVIKFMNHIDCGTAYRVYMGDNAYSARTTKLNLKGVKADYTLVGHNDADYKNVLKPNTYI